MKNFVFAMSVAILVVAPMTTSAQVASSLHCEGGEVQVCTAPTTDGGWEVLFDTHARPRFDCDVATDTGVDLRCVDANQICQDAKQVCEGLNGDWRWSERRCRCYQHVDEGGGSGSGGGGQGGGDTRVTVVVQTCNAQDFAELSAEMDHLEAANLQTEDLGALQLRAAAVYGRLIECNDGTETATSLIARAARLINAFASDPILYPDYTGLLDDGFSLVHNDLLEIARRPIRVDVLPEENWCTDTHIGRFVCIALPIIGGLAAIFGGVLLYDYYDDGSADGRIHF